jgi:NADH-quinone oxidoreductase subunit C
MAITHEEIVEKLKAQFGEDLLAAEESYGMLSVTIAREQIAEALKFLHGEPSLNFHFMTDLCGVHYPDQKDQELGMVYHLHNMLQNVRIRVKTFFPADNLVVPTATAIWSAAGWMERETYDFYGIIFEGHPDLRRILNMEEMDYFPMLKQYPLEDATRDDKSDKMFGR